MSSTPCVSMLAAWSSLAGGTPLSGAACVWPSSSFGGCPPLSDVPCPSMPSTDTLAASRFEQRGGDMATWPMVSHNITAPQSLLVR